MLYTIVYKLFDLLKVGRISPLPLLYEHGPLTFDFRFLGREFFFEIFLINHFNIFFLNKKFKL